MSELTVGERMANSLRDFADRLESLESKASEPPEPVAGGEDQANLKTKDIPFIPSKRTADDLTLKGWQ